MVTLHFCRGHLQIWGTFQNRRGRMLFLCPVFTRDKTKGHDYKILIVLKCVHLFSSKKGGIAWDFSVSCLLCIHLVSFGIPWWLRWFKKICLQCGRPRARFPWRRECLLTPLFLPGEFHGQWSLVDYSPWGHKELDTTERLSL